MLILAPLPLGCPDGEVCTREVRTGEGTLSVWIWQGTLLLPMPTTKITQHLLLLSRRCEGGL